MSPPYDTSQRFSGTLTTRYVDTVVYRVNAKEHYLELVAELLLQRARVNAALPDEDEARYADELDRCWWVMSRSEQNEVEGAIDC